MAGRSPPIRHCEILLTVMGRRFGPPSFIQGRSWKRGLFNARYRCGALVTHLQRYGITHPHNIDGVCGDTSDGTEDYITKGGGQAIKAIIRRWTRRHHEINITPCHNSSSSTNLDSAGAGRLSKETQILSWRKDTEQI